MFLHVGFARSGRCAFSAVCSAVRPVNQSQVTSVVSAGGIYSPARSSIAAFSSQQKKTDGQSIDDVQVSPPPPTQQRQYEKGRYITKQQYMKEQMYGQSSINNRTGDAETGLKPTRWQRHCLVITRVFYTYSEIPEYVTVGAMNRMHQRMRVVFIVVGSVTFFGFFYGLEIFNNDRIMRDRLRGDPTVGG